MTDAEQTLKEQEPVRARLTARPTPPAPPRRGRRPRPGPRRRSPPPVSSRPTATAPPRSRCDLDELVKVGRAARRLPRAGAAHAGGLRELPQARRARGRRRAGARRGLAGQGAAAGARQPRPGARGRRGGRPAARRRAARALGAGRRARARRDRVVPPAGETFDPNLHEAVATAAAVPEGEDSGTVVEVYQDGYRLGRA